MVDTRVDGGKIAAYLATRYGVGTGGEAFDLRINSRSEQLERLYQATGKTCGLFITAFNPLGKKQSDAANEAAHARLRQDLLAITSDVIEGAGADREGAWPPEKSFLALDVDKATACRLGIKFVQDAVVWADADATPQLLLLR